MATLRAATVARVDARGFVLRVAVGADTGEEAVSSASSSHTWCCVNALDAHTVRVCFTDGAAPPSAPPPPRTPAVLRDAFADCFSVDVASTDDGVTLRTADAAGAPTLTLVVALGAPSLCLSWARGDDGSVFAQDRVSRAYALGRSSSTGCFHACRRAPDDAFFGLGDKTGPLNLAGRRLRTHMTDALGRDPECVSPLRCVCAFGPPSLVAGRGNMTLLERAPCRRCGDPGYKHWPFLLVRTRGACAFGGVSPPAADADADADAPAAEETPPQRRTVYGVYYDTSAAATFDLGCEHSNYHGGYRSFECASGATSDLDYYMLLGPTLPDATRRFLALTGHAPLPPRWTLGYGMTAMPLADARDAQARIGAFVARAAAENVRASSFHFGSGYCLNSNGQRCVLTWNADTFPDPDALIAALHAAGLRVVANVKPCLLRGHPQYADVTSAGLCVRACADAASRAPAVSAFWDGDGAYLDFGNAAAAAWWRAGVTEQLLRRGVDALWNDNNEYEIDEEGTACADADAHGADGGALVPFHAARGAAPLRMCAASDAATRAFLHDSAGTPPGTSAARPWGISRAMSPGCQRHCGTWTGDNASSWASLRWGLRTCAQLALSGLYHSGTDVGGFAGPPPEPELLIRWFQAAAVCGTRFVSNSWKACGTVTCPWMYGGNADGTTTTAMCNAAIMLRLQLMPYLYTLTWHATAAGGDAPPVRPPCWDFGACDEGVWSECDEMMLGPCVLAAPVVTRGQRVRRVRLPAGPACWYDYGGQRRYEAAGAFVTVDAPLAAVPLFCPAGALLPLARAVAAWAGAPHDAPARALRAFPHPAHGASEGMLFEDDGGESGSASGSGCGNAGSGSVTLRFTMRCTPDEVRIAVSVAARQGAYAMPYDAVEVQLPAGEARRVVLVSDGGGAPRLYRAAEANSSSGDVA
jgi:alpha-glucosidase